LEKQEKIKVCHFSSVHSIIDTRVFHRECVSLAKLYDITFIGIGDFTGIRNDVKIIGIKKPNSHITRILFTIWKVFSEAIKTNSELYHIHDAEMIPFAIILSIFGKKVIYDIHENTKEDILLKPWIPGTIKSILPSVYDCILIAASRFMHFIIVIYDKKYLPIFHAYKENYSLIQNFSPIEEMKRFRVEPRTVLPGNHLFYIGMIKDMYYDFNKLIDAVYFLKNENFLVYVHCVGYFGARTNHDFAENKNWEFVKDQIHFYGYLDLDTAYRISMQCRAGMCLKDQPESMMVSHERKFFEYLTIGLPSIFCDKEIYQDVNSRYNVGLSVNLQDSLQIAGALKQIFSNDGFLDTLASNCIKAAEEEFNWESQEQILFNTYSKLLEQN